MLISSKIVEKTQLRREETDKREKIWGQAGPEQAKALSQWAGAPCSQGAHGISSMNSGSAGSCEGNVNSSGPCGHFVPFYCYKPRGNCKGLNDVK